MTVVIEFNSKVAGSLFWELPAEESELYQNLSDEMKVAVNDALEAHLEGSTLLLLSCLNKKGSIGKAIEILAIKGREATEEIAAL